MHYLILGLVLVASTLVLFFAGPRWFGRASPSANPPVPIQALASNAPPASQPKAGKALTRERLNQKLRELQDSKPLIQNEKGAMCYRVAPPPATVDYVCPKDGSRTQYPRTNEPFSAYEAASALSSIRALAKDIKGLELGIDASELCKKCSPDVQHPLLVLVVKVPGEKKENRFRGVTYEDLVLIREFLAGETVHKTDREERSPLKDHLDRIEKLLGIDLDLPAK